MKVLNLASDMLSKLPVKINYESTAERMGASKTPLMVVLLQEASVNCAFAKLNSTINSVPNIIILLLTDSEV